LAGPSLRLGEAQTVSDAMVTVSDSRRRQMLPHATGMSAAVAAAGR
jgi:hypothetical protein